MHTDWPAWMFALLALSTLGSAVLILNRMSYYHGKDKARNEEVGRTVLIHTSDIKENRLQLNDHEGRIIRMEEFKKGIITGSQLHNSATTVDMKN